MFTHGLEARLSLDPRYALEFMRAKSQIGVLQIAHFAKFANFVKSQI